MGSTPADRSAKKPSMGQLLSRLKVVIGTLRELNAEYLSFQQRVTLSPGLPVNDPTLPFWAVPPANMPMCINSALPTHVDVLVIGSGITGVSCVRTLLKKGPPGLRVLVLEARDVCSGATGRNGGHINPSLYNDYVQLKSEFGVESAKRIIRFRRAHLSALREAVEEIGALDHSQIRDVERIDVYLDEGTFKEQVKALEIWREDMPEEAADSRVVEGGEASKVFQLSEDVVGVIVSPGGAAHPYRTVTTIFADLLNRYSDQLDLFTYTPCTGISSPSTTTPHYTIQTSRGITTADHIIHATNGWTSHLLPGMRGKVIPQRATMTAQRPGTGLPTDPTGSRAYVFYYPPGIDYLTQLPKSEGEGDGGELLFGGGTVQGGRWTLSEFGNADDGRYHLGIASYVQGVLPEYFGHANWGAESVDVAKAENSAWAQGRIMAVWTGIIGVSADLQPWVGRVSSAISGRTAPSPPLLTGASAENAVVRSLAPPGEWVSTGYSGEGMVHAWLCAHALALMVLGLEKEEDVHSWFPDEYRLSERRREKATIEQLWANY